MCRKCRATFPNEKYSEHECLEHLSKRICTLEDKVEYLLTHNVENKPHKLCKDGTLKHDW